MATAAVPTISRQAVFPERGVIELTEIEVPPPASDQLLMRVRRVGICATDLHLLEGHIGDPFPLVPGHEFVGEVAAIGDEAAKRRGLRPGDRDRRGDAAAMWRLSAVRGGPVQPLRSR